MHGDTPFQKRVLIPFWVLRLGLMLILIGIYSWALAVVAALSTDDIDDSTGDYWSDSDLRAAKGAAEGVIAALLVLLLICTALDITSIILYARRRLRPLVFLIFNVLQTLFWLVLLILSAIGTAASHNVGVVFNIIVFLLYLGLLIYAGVIYHRERKGGNRGMYQQAPNPGQYEAQRHDFQHQPYNPELVVPQPQAYQSYGGVPQPPVYYNHGATQQPFQSYSESQKAMPQEAAYELPEHTPRYH